MCDFEIFFIEENEKILTAQLFVNITLNAIYQNYTLFAA